MKRVLLYTTAGCHLCDEAAVMLEQACRAFPGMNWRAVEISEESVLIEEYGLRIPVVRIQGNHSELCWPFDKAGLASFLACQLATADSATQTPVRD